MRRINIKGRVAIQVGLIIIYHLFVIWFLDIRMGKLVGINELLIIYFIPIVLLCTTCKMSLKKNIWRYNLVWIVISTLPSSFVLSYFSQMHGNKESEPGIVDISYLDIKIDYGQINLLFYFPLVFSIIQVILMFGIWIMTITKE